MPHWETMNLTPDRSEAPEYFFSYINRVPTGNVLQILEAQFVETLAVFQGISDTQSTYRYAADKWSIRAVVNHLSDTERLFVFRAFWFARGFDASLPSFDQDTAASAANADQRSWESHVEEFRAVRAATLAFFRTLPQEAWGRRGTVTSHPFSVRALAYITAGHVIHHTAILKQRYLG